MSDINFEDKVIGANVRRFRETYGISRDNLAEIFHVSNDGVYRIERGETGLSSAYVHFALFGGRKCVLERSLCGA